MAMYKGYRPTFLFFLSIDEKNITTDLGKKMYDYFLFIFYYYFYINMSLSIRFSNTSTGE